MKPKQHINTCMHACMHTRTHTHTHMPSIHTQRTHTHHTAYTHATHTHTTHNYSLSHCLPSLYTYTGTPTINGPPQFSLDTVPTASIPVFTLTCVSTGGPATTVTWTRDGVGVAGVTSQTVISMATVTYNNTLTVTGRLLGNYECTVTNDRGTAVNSLMLEGESMQNSRLCNSTQY